jgi:phosphatidylglycerol:prolipoprotein diacylglycerol transferase
LLTYPQIDPVALNLGPIKIHWYGIIYIVSFALAWLLAKKHARQLKYDWHIDTINDLIFYGASGAVLGGRIGYVLFYAFNTLLHDPLFVFKIWHGGMSFHGGLLGTIISLLLFAHKNKLTYLQTLDFVAPLVPVGLLLGRIGNFINSELWGRTTLAPWGMIFPNGGPIPRHPSQLYESFAEGVVLFIIIWFYAAKPRTRGTVSALFLICYGSIRFGCEFFREPDLQIGFIAFNWLTMGQLLSLPMIIAGLYMWWFCKKRK